MDITAEAIEDLYNRGGSLELADGENLTRDQLIQYIDNCDIDTDTNGTPLDSQWQILADVLGAPDPSDVGELTTIVAAAHRIEAAEKDRDEAIRRAITEGHQVTAIARAADLSRARIYQIRDGRR